MFKRIMFATVFVTDQDKALAFYTQLGFVKRADNVWAEGRFLVIGIEGDDLNVVLWPGSQAEGRPFAGAEPISVPGVLFIESDDLRKDFAELKARGIPLEEDEPQAYAYGLRATALDPDGNRVSLRQPPRS